MNHTYLGIDMGTSAIKVILIDGRKRVICQSCREYETSHPFAGWSEIDPRVWYESMLECLKEVLKGRNAESVRTIGVTGQMHTLVLLDAEGEPVRPALMWSDKRTKDLIPELKEKLLGFREGDYLSEIISTGSPAANLCWMMREEPENMKMCRHFQIGPDYLVYRLTGQISTDYCEASTSSLYCIRAKEWSEEMRQLLGLSPDMYPKLHGSGQTVGRILPELSTMLGLSPETEVIAGTGDNPAAAISTGCLGRDYPVLSLGTSGVLMVPTDNIDRVSRGKIILYSTDAKVFRYLVQGVVQSTGESVNWWVRKVLGKQDYSSLTEKLNQADLRALSASQLLFYPHLNGDKTIYADSELRGAFLGLSADTSAEEMFYAVMEGLCFAFRELSERMNLSLSDYGCLKVVGGGSKSPVWLQALSNILEIKIEKMEGMIGPGFGIALLAYAKEEHIPLGEITKDCLRIERIFEPDPETASICQEKYKRYLRIHGAMKYINGKTA